jgi:hypothetical protein
MHEQLAPVLPAGTDPEAVLSGRADVSESELDLEPAAARPVRKSTEEDSFEHRDWLADGRQA